MSTPPKKSQTFHKKSHLPEISQPPLPPHRKFLNPPPKISQPHRKIFSTPSPPKIVQPPPRKFLTPPPENFSSPPQKISQTPLKISQPSKNMLTGNPPPPHHIPFPIYLFIPLFLHFSKKNLKILEGGVGLPCLTKLY